MPTMEEVVGELRKAQLDINHLSCQCCLGKPKQHLERIAAQVELMRCETCKNAFAVTGAGGEGIHCPWIGCGGCWKWEDVDG